MSFPCCLAQVLNSFGSGETKQNENGENEDRKEIHWESSSRHGFYSGHRLRHRRADRPGRRLRRDLVAEAG